MKDAKHEDLRNMLIIWIGQKKVQNGKMPDEFIKEQEKVLEKQARVTNSIHKNWYVFCSKEWDYIKDGQH